jgi:2-oxo-4-hydroxy-4-carboxy-5-ureidoimidazoline decarboxylase
VSDRDGAVARLNALPRDEVIARLTACCGSSRWAQRTADARPFTTRAELLRTSDAIWSALNPDDWLEAFRSHPEIGARSTAGWSAQEQAGLRTEAADVTERLAAGNRDYREHFGYIFIVCATGRSGVEMLNLLGARLRNGPAEELKIAAEEQRKITAIRIDKMLETL